ncbi:MAG: hypothetical protein J5825_05295 [Lachnospiraceae bacterium]|nr:hypothetical protein [Lachnospiraceae bacterium]
MKNQIGKLNERTMNIRKQRLLLEGIYIAAASVIVVLSVLAFLFQEHLLVIFPIIFLLAAAINILSAYRYLRRDRNHKRHLGPGIVFSVCGGVLIIVAVICVVMLIV